MGVLLDGSIGSFNFVRAFGMVQTGEFTSFGTKAWFAASKNTYDHWRGNGEINKWQINGRVYQPLGSSRRLRLDRGPLQREPQQQL